MPKVDTLYTEIHVDRQGHIRELKQAVNDTKTHSTQIQGHLDKINMAKAYRSANMFFAMFVGGSLIYGFNKAFRTIIATATEGDQKFASAVQGMQNSAKGLGATIGEYLIPPLEKAMGLATDVANKVNTAIQASQHRGPGTLIPTNTSRNPLITNIGGSAIDSSIVTTYGIDRNAMYEAELYENAKYYSQGPGQQYKMPWLGGGYAQPVPRQMNYGPFTPGRGAGENGGRFTAGSSAPVIDEQLGAMEDRFRQFNTNFRDNFDNTIYGAFNGMGLTWKSVLNDMGDAGKRFISSFIADIAQAQLQAGLTGFMSGNKYLAKYAPAMGNATPGMYSNTEYILRTIEENTARTGGQ